MPMNNISLNSAQIGEYDIVICGAGISGLWLLNILITKGFSVLLIEKKSIGGIQTIASQGMIHGGQRYLLNSNASVHADTVSMLPARWNACLEGNGELDLRKVNVLSDSQVMWPTGGSLSHLAASAASHILFAKTKKLTEGEIPEALVTMKDRTVFKLPEKVLDISSLVENLYLPCKDNVRQGVVDSLSRDGRISVSGCQLRAQIIICAAGVGNEEFLSLLGAGQDKAQQRPLRQIMVKEMPFPLYGHGITTSYKPSITVTSHPLPSGGYVWYLGGAIADDVLSLTEADAISFAQKEMKRLFGHLDWSGKEWATWYGMRAEAYSHNGQLPNGPVVQQYGKAMVIWPTKLTMAPLLGDLVLNYLNENDIFPRFSGSPLLLNKLGFPPFSPFPWTQAIWSK